MVSSGSGQCALNKLSLVIHTVSDRLGIVTCIIFIVVRSVIVRFNGFVKCKHVAHHPAYAPTQMWLDRAPPDFYAAFDIGKFAGKLIVSVDDRLQPRVVRVQAVKPVLKILRAESHSPESASSTKLPPLI